MGLTKLERYLKKQVKRLKKKNRRLKDHCEYLQEELSKAEEDAIHEAVRLKGQIYRLESRLKHARIPVEVYVME